MAQHRIIKAPAFDSQLAGQNNICNLKTGGIRYHKLILDYKEDGNVLTKAQLETALQEVVIKINEKDIWRINLAKYFATQKTKDRDFTISNGKVVIHFANYMIEGQLQQELTSIGTMGVANMTFEIEIADDRVNPTLRLHAEVDDVQEAPGLVRHMRQKVWAVTEIGELQKSIRGRVAQYSGLTLFETNANDIADLKLNYEGIYILDCEPSILKSSNQDFGYTVVSKQIYIPFDRGVLSDALPTRLKSKDGQMRDSAIDFTLQMAAAASVTLVEDFYASPNV